VTRFRDGRFHEKTVKFYGAQLLLALTHLHANGVVYRDLKPENLLLDRKGHLKLTRRTPRHEYDNGRSFRYNEYLAPEILAGGPPVPHALDCKCDWWSYGAILYQMLVGLSPFSHPSVNGTNMKIMMADFSFPKPTLNSPALSSEAQDLIHGLLNKSTKKRLDGKQMRRHPFFSSIDWIAMERKEVKPPTRPLRRTVGTNRDSASTSESSSLVSATTTYDSTSRSFFEVES